MKTFRLSYGFYGAWGENVQLLRHVFTTNPCQALQPYDWPGNVRELRNVIERVLITSRCGSDTFELAILNRMFSSLPASRPSKKTETVNEVFTEYEMSQREKMNIEMALKQTDWKIYGRGGAAELLDIKPTTLLSRIKMGMEK